MMNQIHFLGISEKHQDGDFQQRVIAAMSHC